VVKTRKDKIRNERIRGHLGVALIEQKIRDRHLSWFGHVQRIPNTTLVKKCIDWQVSRGCKRSNRPLKTWMKSVREDILELKYMRVCEKTTLLRELKSM